MDNTAKIITSNAFPVILQPAVQTPLPPLCGGSGLIENGSMAAAYLSPQPCVLALGATSRTLGVYGQATAATSENPVKTTATGLDGEFNTDHRFAVFKTFAQVSSGLHPDEVKSLQKIFDDHKVLDLKTSGLVHFEDWLERLCERLTAAVEKTGEFYPEYRFYVMNSEAPEAFVYKFRSPGQKFYRGHVFFSAGLIRQMAATLVQKKSGDVGADTVADLSDTLVGLLMKGLQGVLGHEAAHPKQDELIKWDWRAARDSSVQSHGQADEMSTDLLAIKILKDAELEPSSLLTGLELLFGHQPSTGNFLMRGAMAMFSSHPQQQLRLNILRGGLVRLRRDEGKGKIAPLEIHADGLRADLARVVNVIDTKARLAVIEAEAKAHGESVVLRFVNDMLTNLQRLAEPFFPVKKDGTYAAYLDWMEMLKVVLNAHPDLTPAEAATLTKFCGQIYGFGIRGFGSGIWTSQSVTGGFDATMFSLEITRRAQRVYADHPLFNLPLWRDWLARELKNGLWQFATPPYYACVLMPRDRVLAIYTDFLARADELAEDQRADTYLKMLGGLVLMGGDHSPMEIEILKRLTTLMASSEGAQAVIVGNLFNLFHPVGQDQSFRGYALERFLKAGEAREEYTRLWAELFKQVLSLASLAITDLSIGQGVAMDSPSWLWEKLHWAAVPGDFLKTFEPGRGLDTRFVTDWFVETIRSASWQAMIRKNFNDAALRGVQQDLAPLFNFYNFSRVFIRTDSAFTPQDRGRLLDAIDAAVASEPAGSALFKGRVLFAIRTIKEISGEVDHGFLIARAAKLAQILKENGYEDVFAALEDILQGADNVRKALFANGDSLIRILDDWLKRGFIDRPGFERALERYFFAARPEKEVTLPLESLSLESAYVLWKYYRSKDDPLAVTALFQKIVGAFRVDLAEGDVEGLSEDTRRYLQAGIGIAPGYDRFFEFIKKGLAADFRALIGIGRGVGIGDPAYADGLRRNYDVARDFIKLIFNPDGQSIANEFRGLVKYHRLDGPAEMLVSLIPEGVLSAEQEAELWQIFSAKRANRHTDAFFESRVSPRLKKLPPAERAAAYKKILDGAHLRSERLKNELMRVAIDDELQRMSRRAGEFTDREVRPLIEWVTSRIPDSSRFRDDLLEKIAWKLELSEAQLVKFIEPLKSFNFRAMNPLTVNLLSSLSIVLEKLKNSEKLALIRYFKEPKGSLLSVLPWLARFNADIEAELRKFDIKDFDWIDHLESFVRDAGEGDRLVLIELLVGSRGSGLWHADEKWRDELYQLAGLELGSTKRKLFDSYLKALPAFEHSVTLSYLIATQGEGGGGSELLRILETFDTPGIKFAQMASVLGIFGPERSEELAAAKDRALPPSRALVFEQLKKYLTAEEFSRIKRIRRLLGSGSVKFVALVEYEDGSKQAVSIRRPFLDERIAATLDIVKVWSEELKNDPEFANEYDFDYYLEALSEQLGEEVRFEREIGLANDMMDEYAKIREHKGWRFEPVRPSKTHVQNDYVLNYAAVEGAVPFDELSDEDKLAASELVVAAELHLLFDHEHFDADRHMGNFLFDPKTKRVYPIDMGQAYRLQGNGWFKPGDPYAVAEILYGVSDKDAKRGAATLVRAFLRIEEDAKPHDENFVRELTASFVKILSGDESMKMKTFKTLAELNKRRVHLPLRFTMGVIKGLMIVLNEKYAKTVGPDFIRERIEKFIRCQMIKGVRFKAADWIRKLAG